VKSFPTKASKRVFYSKGFFGVGRGGIQKKLLKTHQKCEIDIYSIMISGYFSGLRGYYESKE